MLAINIYPICSYHSTAAKHFSSKFRYNPLQKQATEFLGSIRDAHRLSKELSSAFKKWVRGQFSFMFLSSPAHSGTVQAQTQLKSGCNPLWYKPMEVPWLNGQLRFKENCSKSPTCSLPNQSNLVLHKQNCGRATYLEEPYQAEIMAHGDSSAQCRWLHVPFMVCATSMWIILFQKHILNSWKWQLSNIISCCSSSKFDTDRTIKSFT